MMTSGGFHDLKLASEGHMLLIMARITGAGLSLRTTVQAVPATYLSPGARQYGTHALDRVW